MAEILFIKTSSLGDVVHHMPAITDARRQQPGARLSWVVEEAFAPLARLHPGIDEVIPVASRRWRSRLHLAATWREIGKFRRILHERQYEAVVDTQGLLRTAVIAKAARGVRHGYDMASIREPLASWFYDVRHRVDRGVHAVARNRVLTGVALGYEPPAPIDYGLDRAALARTADQPYVVLLHATAEPIKEWATAHWVTVARGVLERGFAVVLPWGRDVERARSEAIAAALGDRQGRVQIPDRRPLDEVAALIAGATAVVGVDTGLLHVGAAFGVPLVGIFVGSEPGLTGPRGNGPIAIMGRRGAPPEPAEVLRALDGVRQGAA